MATTTVRPVAENERIVAIDVLRGVALLGILPMNIQSFAMLDAAYQNPTAYGDLHGGNFLVWLFSHVLADLKFVTIFSMLFGAGILLMSRRAEAAGRRPGPIHYRRMIWLVIFGILHGFLLWSGDILFTYGFCGLFVYPARRLRPRNLIVIGLLLFSVTTVSMVGIERLIAHQSPATQQSMKEDMWDPLPAQAARETAAFRGGWRTQMSERASNSSAMETVFLAAYTFWRVTGLMLIGMALFQLGVFSAASSPAAYRKMIAAAVVVGIPVTLYGTWRDFARGWEFLYSFFLGSQYNYWASLLISAGWIGSVMLMLKGNVLRPLTDRLAAIGRMAFSNYILQTLLCSVVFYGNGLGLFGKVSRVGQFAIVVAVWTVQLLVSPLWLRYFQFGPLEWVWRSLTYFTLEPFRREPALVRISSAPL
jgi:uncharacterized protein